HPQQQQKARRLQHPHGRASQHPNLPPRSRQFPALSGRGRGGHRALISPLLSDTDSYDFFPEGSVSVGVAQFPHGSDNNNNNNNNNTNTKSDKACVHALPLTKANQAVGTGSAAVGFSKQTAALKGGVRIHQADYDNVVGAKPALGRVLDEGGGTGGEDIIVHTFTYQDRGVMVEQGEGAGDWGEGEPAIDRREETICIGPRPHTTARLTAAARGGTARDGAGAERWASCERGGDRRSGEGGAGEHCSRTVAPLSVSTGSQCTARDSRHSSAVGKACTARGGGGGGGGWREAGGVASVSHELNNRRETQAKTALTRSDRAVGDDGSGAHSTGGADDDVTLQNGAAVVGTTSLNATSESGLSHISAIQEDNTCVTDYSASNLTRRGTNNDQSTENSTESSVCVASQDKSDNNHHIDGGATNIHSNSNRNSVDCTSGASEMGNQTSNAKVSIASADSGPRKIFRDKKVQGPASRVDTTVHFRKDNSDTTDSDGGSISIVSETKLTSPVVVNGVDTPLTAPVVRDVLNDLNKAPLKSTDSPDYEEATSANNRNDFNNIPPSVELVATEVCDVREKTLSGSSSTLTPLPNDSQMSPVENGQDSPTLVTTTNGSAPTTTTAAAVTQLGETARSVKLGPKTEDIYALPVPREMRPQPKCVLVRQRDVREEDESQAAAPPPLPDRLSEDAALTSPEEASPGSQPHARQLNTVQVTCQMKKSHTTCGSLNRAASARDGSGDCPSFRGYYYNSACAPEPGYDYFSLGRKPKRVTRVKTLTDSHGMAMSLDKLLKLRQAGTRRAAPTPS
ncbi:hypothetical protein EGW08_022249, partial [Elysia chlorotica]